jgi:hypothetical protein
MQIQKFSFPMKFFDLRVFLSVHAERLVGDDK